MRNLLYTFLFILHCGLLSAQTNALQTFLNIDDLAPASVGFMMKEIGTGKVIASYEPMVCRNPASVTKIITTATAIELLTDTFRFRTKIEYSGTIKDSVLNGNLYIRGGGDPTLESAYNPVKNRFFSSVLDTIKGLGIKKIKGHIIGDASFFREDGSPFNWLVEDVGSSYSPTPSSLSIRDNLLSFVVTSDSTGFSYNKVTPYTPLFQPKIEMTQDRDIPTGWRFTKVDYSWTPTIRGNLPIGICQYLKTEIAEPALFAADSLRRLLIHNGIEVDSAATSTRWFKPDSVRKVFYTYQSAPLKDIERITNHKSINLFAENIFTILSKQKDSIGACTTWNASNAIAKFWKKNGLDSDKNFQVDGSGMSMKNALSPQYIVDVLSYMYNDSVYFKSFLSTLPIAGKNGTVTSFMKGTKLEGKAYIKSGSMERVQNYAGYINYNNKWYVFCFMVSNFAGQRPALKKQMSDLLNELIENDNKTTPKKQ